MSLAVVPTCETDVVGVVAGVNLDKTAGHSQEKVGISVCKVRRAAVFDSPAIALSISCAVARLLPMTMSSRCCQVS